MVLQPLDSFWVIQSVSSIMTSTDLLMTIPQHLQFASQSMVSFPVGLLGLLINRNVAHKRVTVVPSVQQPSQGWKQAKSRFTASVLR